MQLLSDKTFSTASKLIWFLLFKSQPRFFFWVHTLWYSAVIPVSAFRDYFRRAREEIKGKLGIKLRSVSCKVHVLHTIYYYSGLKV